MCAKMRSETPEPPWGSVVPVAAAGDRGQRMNERLWEIYEQLCLVEMRGLDEFVRRVKGGEFGDFSRDDMIAFLREIEANMLDNIQTKALEHHVYAEMAEEVSEQTQRMFDELIEEFERA